MDLRKQDVRKRMDAKLMNLKQASDFPPPPKGWIRAIRETIGMSGVQFAERLGVTSQSIADLEKSEALGTIQLASLRKAADALDCDLVYALVPKTSLDGSVQGRARKIARRALLQVTRTMTLESQQATGRNMEDEIADYIRDHVRDRDIWDDK
jgi:predicted DNA-binding mobile mystery protein A